MPAETTRFRWSFLPDSLLLPLPLLLPPPLLLLMVPLLLLDSRSKRRKKKVTGRCLIVSNDNLMLLSVFAHSAAALSLLPSPLPCSLVQQLPTTGSASRKGTRAGGTPTHVHRAAATPPPPMGTGACPVLNFEINRGGDGERKKK